MEQYEMEVAQGSQCNKGKAPVESVTEGCLPQLVTELVSKHKDQLLEMEKQQTKVSVLQVTVRVFGAIK